jgi:hypothetical protein
VPIVYRQVKGSPLTIAELDGNFEYLDDRVQILEDDQTTGGNRQIDYIEQVGNSLIVHYDDATTDGPFDLGTLQLLFRGEWQVSTLYSVYDVITAGGATYMVLFGHTSDDTSFDPGANDGEGNDYYGLLLENPSISLPTGGAIDQVLTKVSATNFDTTWATRGVPPDGFLGDVLVKTSDDEGDYAWGDPGVLTVPPVMAISTTELDPTLSHANRYMRCTHASGCTVTIPDNATVAFAIGTEMHFVQRGAGSVVLVAPSETDSEEVTINTRPGYEPETVDLGAVITAKKVATNEWDVFGGLMPETA